MLIWPKSQSLTSYCSNIPHAKGQTKKPEGIETELLFLAQTLGGFLLCEQGTTPPEHFLRCLCCFISGERQAGFWRDAASWRLSCKLSGWCCCHEPGWRQDSKAWSPETKTDQCLPKLWRQQGVYKSARVKRQGWLSHSHMPAEERCQPSMQHHLIPPPPPPEDSWGSTRPWNNSHWSSISMLKADDLWSHNRDIVRIMKLDCTWYLRIQNGTPFIAQK